MNDETNRDFVSRHQAKVREEFRHPDFDSFNHRSPVPLPRTVREFFSLGEQLYGSCFEIECGIPLCVQYFCPLGVTSIDACERNGWRFVGIGVGCDGEEILVSLDNKQAVFVDWSAFGEPPEDIGVNFACFLGSLVQLLKERVP